MMYVTCYLTRTPYYIATSGTPLPAIPLGSNVTNMARVFNHAKSFNRPLNNWDVSNVTNTHSMFGGAESFNQPLNEWDVSNVTNMDWMFNHAKSFNQPLNEWNVGNVTNMEWMLFMARSFNKSINNWDVRNVTNMGRMFCGAESFNQPLNEWDVSHVTNMRFMFQHTNIGSMLEKHNLSEKQFFVSPTNKKVYHEVFVWPRKKDYVTFLVNNHYLPLNKHQEKHEYHPLFDNTDISKYIACYL